jgi:glycosyltransferase involved in cell wall biosynthesis
MHVALLGPIATAEVAPLLRGGGVGLPPGYEGAPLMGVLVEGLLRAGHRVTAITLSRELPLRRDAVQWAHGDRLAFALCPLRPRAWPPNGRWPGRIVDLYRLERCVLQDAIVQAQPDLVHAHWLGEFAWAALASGLPHVVTSHDDPVRVARFQRGLRRRGYRWLRAAMAWHALRRAQSLTAVSPYLAQAIQGTARTPVAVVPNPVSPRALALRREPEAGRARLLMVGHGFDARKNAEAGLRAFAAVAAAWPDVELCAVGHDFGPGQAAERWWHREAPGLAGRVRFLGPLPHDEVLAWMRRSDLLLHPALEEAFGVVIAEAMAVGLPVVAGERSGAVPWVTGDAAWLVDVAQPQAIAAALERWRAGRAAAEALAVRARTEVESRFSADAVVNAYGSLYAQVLATQVRRDPAAR